MAWRIIEFKHKTNTHENEYEEVHFKSIPTLFCMFLLFWKERVYIIEIRLHFSNSFRTLNKKRMQFNKRNSFVLTLLFVEICLSKLTYQHSKQFRKTLSTKKRAFKHFVKLTLKKKLDTCVFVCVCLFWIRSFFFTHVWRWALSLFVELVRKRWIEFRNREKF